MDFDRAFVPAPAVLRTEITLPTKETAPRKHCGGC
jgi:hypothetical protein